MQTYISGTLSGVAEVLKREAIKSLDSKDVAQHIILGSEDLAPLAIQLMFSASQKNDAQILGAQMPMVGHFGFVGSASHLIMMFLDDSEAQHTGPILPGVIAHYVDWLGRSQHAKSRLNGEVFNQVIAALETGQPDAVVNPDLRNSLNVTFRQIKAHQRLDVTARMKMLEEAAVSDDLMFRLGGHTQRLIILTGEKTRPEERLFFESLRAHIKDVTWVSTHPDDRKGGEFTPVNDGSSQAVACTSMYQAVCAAFKETPSHKEGGYLHSNHIGSFSKLFGLSLSMIAASNSLGHSIEWYALLRGMLNLPHEDTVSLIKDLNHYHHRNLPIEGVNETLGRNNPVGKAFTTCYNLSDDPELAYRTAYQVTLEQMEKRGVVLEGLAKDIVNDINQYYRWLARVSKNTKEFYLMACLYPYTGRYPKHHIYQVELLS